jgi:lipopolysaccharide transport system permease protein
MGTAIGCIIAANLLASLCTIEGLQIVLATQLDIHPAYQREPLYVIKPNSGWQLVELAELWHFREALFALATRDIKVRYRQTYLGILWVVLQPLMGAGVFSLVFHTVAQIPPPKGVPYFLVAYSGFVAWNLFNSTLTKTSTSLVSNTQLLTKVYFPRLLLPLSSVVSSLLDCIISLTVLLVAMACCGVLLSPNIVSLPIWLGLLLMLSTGLGLGAGVLMVPYRDVQHMLPVFVQLLLYASPVGYSLAQMSGHIPSQYMLLFYLNPLSGLVEAFRWSIIGGTQMPLLAVIFSAVLTFCVFIAGLVSFKRMERKLSDVI